MKKLFLTSGLILCMACPAFAVQNGVIEGEVANPNADECVQSVLGTDVGPATLEAIWNADSYDVIYAPGLHGTGGATYTDGVTYDQNYTVLAPTAVSTPVVAHTGYTFTTWNDGTADRATGYAYSPYHTAGDLTLTAQYRAHVATITLDDKLYRNGAGTDIVGGQAATTASSPTPVYTRYDDHVYTDSTRETQMTGNFTVPTLTGYTFGGFYTAQNGGGTQKIAANGSFTESDLTNLTATDNGSETLYAKWTAIGATLTYSCGTKPAAASAQSITTGTLPSSQALTYDVAYSLTAPSGSGNTAGNTECALPGWHFTTWDCTGGVALNNAVGSQGAYNGTATAVTCTPHWVQNTISLTWDDQGADITSVGGTTNTCTYDEGIAIPTVEPEKTGYTFGGWEVQTQSQNP